jgi:hypothetical protein
MRQSLQGHSQNAFIFLREFNDLPYHDQSQIIDENKYTGLTEHFMWMRQSLQGHSQNAFIFLREFNDLPYHDQSQIIDKNKYTGLALH